MSKVNGVFKGYGNNFLGTFKGGPMGTVKVTGSFSQSLPQFTISPASVTYNNMTDLEGSYEIAIKSHSFVGTTSIDIMFQEGDTKLHLTGTLSNAIPEKSVVSGESIWVPVLI
ncbi:hypothetical protein F5887DRAFT_292358 [Amanita rubescens]|nr:hypothetical protein F5887DRAFT_292358 [Amanita rubescens]